MSVILEELVANTAARIDQELEAVPNIVREWLGRLQSGNFHIFNQTNDPTSESKCLWHALFKHSVRFSWHRSISSDVSNKTITASR